MKTFRGNARLGMQGLAFSCVYTTRKSIWDRNSSAALARCSDAILQQWCGPTHMSLSVLHVCIAEGGGQGHN